ncbi:cytochrome p450 protein [Rutstroemia sp. NJR-2017a WRK4]|nr:cytochrome p450 protein [Rutstroemia sp. NJR-2017a WRK4]
MTFKSIIPITAFLSFTCLAAPHDKRTTYTDITLYAYGQNISGLPILYGNTDGLAYIGTTTATNSTSALSWDIDSKGSLPWNATVVNSTAGGEFYIVNGGSSNLAAGFATANTTLPTNATTSGFSLFGGQVVYVDADFQFLSQFWATETFDGFWQLTWNSDGAHRENSVPVTVKMIPPASA